MTKRHAPISQEAVVSAFRQLSDEHAARRLAPDGEQAWTRLQVRRIVATLPQRNSRPWLWTASFVAVAAIALMLLRTPSAQPPPLRYEVQGAHETKGLITTQNKPATVAFSDGSTINASRDTTVAIALRDPHGALARLARGSLDVRVDHRDETNWRFIAGPYEVIVVGTRFNVTWEPEEGSFRIALQEGQVRVLGDDIGVRTVSAGEILELHAQPERSSPQAVPQAASSAAPAPSPLPQDSSAVARAPRPERLAHSNPSTEQNWADWVAKGDFEKVLRAAERAGLSNVEATGSAEDLKALAQASHYVGRTDVSLEAWQTIRRRFARGGAAGQSAFFIARIHEQLGQHDEAGRWLDIYLEESPSGVYASEALGRKLVLAAKSHGSRSARSVARRYLEQFPNGPYAKTARDMLDAD